MTPELRKQLGPHYETACDLARGFNCGNCDTDQAKQWRCVDDGCCSLRDGIYEEMIAALKRANSGDGTKAPPLTGGQEKGAA